MSHTGAARAAIPESADVHTLRVAANDNSQAEQERLARIGAFAAEHAARKRETKKRIREIESENYERLIDAMSSDERAKYNKNGWVPGHLTSLLCRIEDDISDEIHDVVSWRYNEGFDRDSYEELKSNKGYIGGGGIADAA